MKQQIVNVVGAAIIHSGKIFIAKRRTLGQNFGKWEFPGGKVEEHEHDKDALTREIQEELNWQIRVISKLSKGDAISNDKHISLTIYLAELLNPEVEPQLNAHSAYRWVSIAEMHEYDYPEADMPAVKKLIEGGDDIKDILSGNKAS